MLDSPQEHLVATVGALLDQPAGRGTVTQLGYFVYGPPGRGKTWLMRALFEAAPVPDRAKRHVHFHDFYRALERQLGAYTSAREAINATVKELLTDTRLVFFDELHVHDPGSAALLNRLLQAIATQGIPTLITSNYEPENLLADPGFHHVIEPSIRVLREYFTIYELDDGTDYRTLQPAAAQGFAAGSWLVASPQDETETLRTAGLTPPAEHEATTVLEGHRALHARAVRDSTIWFDFLSLLTARSSTSDFLELTETFDTLWVLTGVPELSTVDLSARQRFVTLIDVLVERDIPLVVSSTISRDQLVDIADPPPDLFRTASRLAMLGPHS